MLLTKERFNQLREEKEQLIADYKALRSERSRLSEEFTGYEEKQVAMAGINEDLERVSHEIERMEELLETSAFDPITAALMVQFYRRDRAQALKTLLSQDLIIKLEETEPKQP